MIRRLVLVFLWSTLVFCDEPKRVMVDKVLAILYHSEGPTLILQSHLRPDLADSIPTLKDVIVKELVLQRAKQLKIPLTDVDKERHLARAQEQLGMSREEIKEFFRERGLTLEEAREELGKMLLIEMTVDHIVRSKAYVSAQEIEEYHKKNPLVFYEIKQTFIPYGAGSKSLQRTLLLRDIEQSSEEFLKKYQWSDAITVKGADISQEKAQILMVTEPGSLIVGNETDEGVTILQLVSKKEVPLAERKQEISSLLGKDRYKTALDEFYESLLKEAAPFIRFIDKKDSFLLTSPVE